jgi:6-phosphogluconolactonase
MTMAPAELVFASSFAAGKDGGIQALVLDPVAGTLAPAARTPGSASFFLAVGYDRRTLYSLSASSFGTAATEEVTAWRIVDGDGRLALLGRRPAGGAASCFVTPDPTGRVLLLAHYTSGTVATLPLAADGSLAGDALVIRHAGSGPDATRQERPHPHAMIPAPGPEGAPRFVVAADLGCDAIFRHRLDPSGRLVPEAAPAARTRPGAGPRHLAFHPDGTRLYVVNELDSTVGVYDFDAATGELAARQVVSTLPAGFHGANLTADLTLTPDGRFLYATNRGHDSIAAFRVAADGGLEPIEIVPSGGRGPQHLAIAAAGGLLLCAAMAGSSIAVLRIDADSGRLEPAGPPFAVPAPSCLALVPTAGLVAAVQ